jgi:hypothetical protein
MDMEPATIRTNQWRRAFLLKNLSFILILTSLCACLQNTSIEKACERERIVYVNNPDPKDSLCIGEIQRAKADIHKRKIVFTQTVGFAYGHMRYEDELRVLCKENGLELDFDLISCIVVEGQTQGCYGDYMDEVIFKKFGHDFKESLHRQADSLFLINTNKKNRAVEYWDCDDRPRLPGETKRTNDYLPDIHITASGVELKGNKGLWPFFDLGFIVEKDSTLSGFYVRNFVAEQKENEKYKDKLFAIAVEHIKTNYPVWIPGKIKGVPVRINNNVRIFLKPE